jgi:hypothetical protein
MKDKQKNILIKTNDLFVSNVILEINRNNGDYFRQLFNVGTEAIMIIIRNEDDFREEIISCINNCITITSLQILTDFDVFLKYKEHIMSYEKLGLIICANSNENSVEQLNNLNIVKLSKSINEVIKDQSTSPSNFSISKKNYIESLKYNTYLYGKLYVNSHGDVFNSPCSDRLITNIRKDDFSESIREFFYQSSEIKLSNDFCDVCKDCEYRNVCVSARIPVMRGNREGYFEGECNYNPYIGKWDWEIGYSSLSECGVTSDKFGFRIDKKVLKHKIKELWRN